MSLSKPAEHRTPAHTKVGVHSSRVLFLCANGAMRLRPPPHRHADWTRACTLGCDRWVVKNYIG